MDPLLYSLRCGMILQHEAPPMKGSLGKSEIVLDHLILGISDLEKGIDWLRAKTGVTAIIGGSHPGAGTSNALLSLGGRQYIEIIAIDPNQTQTSRMAGLLRDLDSPRIITWAASTGNIESLKQIAKDAGLCFEGPLNGSRVKPNGSTLRWKTLRVISDFGDVIPFFIEWDADTVHPSVDSPSGCRLNAFEISHPQPEQIRETLGKLGITAMIQPGERARLEAVIDTPGGIARIS